MSTLADSTSTRSCPRLQVALLRAGIASLTATLCGAAALVSGRNPFTPSSSALARVFLSPTGVAWLFLGVGLIGVLTAGWALSGRRVGGAPRVLAAAAVLQLLVLGVALQSVSTIALAGYLFAMAAPFGLIWLAVQVVRHDPRLRWAVLAALAVLALWGGLTRTLHPTHLARLAEQLGAGFARQALSLVFVVLVAATATCWVLLALTLARHTRSAARVGDWALRHRRTLTLLAAAGPLPYALVRASWLTPWPLMVPPGAALDPAMRLWGLLLGAGALLGSVLTIGLLRPWGVTYPGWMPWVAGRPVPVRAATIPGGLVAGVLCASAAPMLQAFIFRAPETMFEQVSVLQRLGSTLIFPFWCWGPALALAVWGYALSRRRSAT